MIICDHDWNTTSALRVAIETPALALASIFPTAPLLLPIEYCRECGVVRLKPVDLMKLRAAEAEAGL